MESYFLDTSAIVKRYVPEAGHLWTQSLCRAKQGKMVFIAQAALVEVMAALGKMSREQPPRLNAQDRLKLVALFQRHVRQRYSVLPVTPEIYTAAGKLCFQHPLRAYDAVQLACAMQIRDELVANGFAAPTFVSADNALLVIAAAEGLAVDNPNSHP